MKSSRRCIRASCDNLAVATLTYSYQDSSIVVGPISMYPEPHSYDLCSHHAHTVVAPRGWNIIRLTSTPSPAEAVDTDDLLALADAVATPEETQYVGVTAGEVPRRESRERILPPTDLPPIGRGHLRLMKDR